MEYRELTKEVEKLLTPQEHLFLGHGMPFEPRALREYYMPDKMLDGEESVEEVDLQRQALRVKSRFLSDVLGVDRDLAIYLAPLDRHGRTLEDPKILGLINRTTDEPEEHHDKDRDLTLELYQKYHEKGIDLHLRRQSKDKEQEPQRGEQKG